MRLYCTYCLGLDVHANLSLAKDTSSALQAQAESLGRVEHNGRAPRAHWEIRHDGKVNSKQHGSLIIASIFTNNGAYLFSEISPIS